MRNAIVTAVCLTALAGGHLYAQEAPASEEPTISAAPPNPDEIQRTLREKAKRIPRRGLASALRAGSDERANRAETIVRAPDIQEIRDSLNATREADLATQTDTLAATRAITALPPIKGIRAVANERLKAADRRELIDVRVPVLIPGSLEFADRMKLYGMKNVYTASASIDTEASLMISGTCNRVIGGDPDIVEARKRLSVAPRRLEGTNAAYHISRNDFGVDLSFSKFGCGYVVTIECGDPAADPRCSGDEYITGLAESMFLANPELAGGE
ncbi:hypothetical protein ABFZ85_08635 [Hyphococcus formosus]|uniref:hypothetical protein n=1 Tax=Hyphococcus formosus TaxID=3143534 RepID=UPI00398ACBE3